MHDLRHSAASFLINANQSLYVVSKYLGHTQIRTSARYSHLAPEKMLSAADGIAEAAGLGSQMQVQ
jgi:site-specific recombinase XerD